ncbi:MAG TPA: hypothetical protein VMU67_17405 [Steroidobacteraceae bacterium]|nr:hypothetical protein [Steroidobacteraceae bacterium]
MSKRGALRRRLALLVVLAPLCGAGSLAVAVAPATALSPDERPILVLVASPSTLMVVHHAHPLPPSEAEQLALKLGLFIAGPIIRRHAREGVDPLPTAWQTSEPDRGFIEALSAALDRTQANWPWRTLRIVDSEADARTVLAESRGDDVAVVRFKCDLDDDLRSVQFVARASVELVRDADTPRESRTQFQIRHLAEPLAADWGRPRKYASEFRPDGPLDHEVDGAALDLSRALAVTIARLTTATPSLTIASRHFADLTRKPKCAVCEPGDPVLHEEPGRVWVAPGRLAGTVLSLPVEAGAPPA